MMSAFVTNIIDRITFKMDTQHDCRTADQIFFVRCLVEDIEPRPLHANFKYHYATSIECAQDKLPGGAFACVLALFDPTSQASVKQLEEVCDVAKSANIPVATISTFNPVWIDNLMHHFDVARHFRAFPSEDDLRAVFENHAVGRQAHR